MIQLLKIPVSTITPPRTLASKTDWIRKSNRLLRTWRSGLILLLISIHSAALLQAQDFQQMIKLIENDRLAPGSTSRSANDFFGSLVAIDGDYAIVGVPSEDEDAIGSNTLSNAGSAYIFVRSGNNWTFQQKIVASDRGAGDVFGTRVSISGDYAIVGASGEDEDAAGGNNQSNAGSAYIFVRNGNTWSQQQKIVASDRAAADGFGSSVSISGDYAVVGAFQEDEDASGGAPLLSAGSAYIFARSGTTWSQQQKIVSSDRASGDFFGYAVSISGAYLIVSALQEDHDAFGGNARTNSGSAYIFSRSGTSWTQQQKIVASDRTSSDLFGFSVAISGDYAIVGAYQEDEDASGSQMLSSAGSAYIFTRSGASWSQQKIVAADRTSNDVFGYSVAISGDYAIVGAYLEDEDASGGNPAVNAGSAYVFFRSGGTWSFQQKIVAADRAAIDAFAVSVAISGNYAIIGAGQEDEDASGLNSTTSAGSAYLFTRSGTNWSQQQKVIGADPTPSDNFGFALAVAGDYAVVGAFNEDEDAGGINSLAAAGAAYIFYRANGEWTFQQKIVAADRGSGDQFGRTVAISGDYIIVGAVNEDDDAAGANPLSNAGSAYIFVRSGTTWSQQQKIVAADRAVDDYFGYSVDISGNYAVVGAYVDDKDAAGLNNLSSAGSAYIFVRSGTIWTQQQKIVASDRTANDNFGGWVAIDGDYTIVGAARNQTDALGANTLTDAGSAYIFVRSGSSWSQQQKIVASDRAASDFFGNSVDISGDYAIVGADQSDLDALGANALGDAGAVYIYTRAGTTWTQQQKIVASDRTTSDNFGRSACISGTDVLVGAYNEDEDNLGANTLNSSGSVYHFSRNGSSWSQQQKFSAADRNADDVFGSAVALSGNRAIIGAYQEDEDASGANNLSAAGSAYVFEKTSDFVWTGVTSTDYNTAGNWSGIAVPTSTSNVIFPSTTPFKPNLNNLSYT